MQFILQAVADKFYEERDYPHCIGALDGTHILIEPHSESGELDQSITLMALCGMQNE